MAQVPGCLYPCSAVVETDAPDGWTAQAAKSSCSASMDHHLQQWHYCFIIPFSRPTGHDVARGHQAAAAAPCPRVHSPPGHSPAAPAEGAMHTAGIHDLSAQWLIWRVPCNFSSSMCPLTRASILAAAPTTSIMCHTNALTHQTPRPSKLQELSACNSQKHQATSICLQGWQAGCLLAVTNHPARV